MGIARGPNLIKNSMVWGFDTGYGIADNYTTTRFYKGKPVDNMATDPIFLNSTAGTFASVAWGGDTGFGEFATNTSPDGGGLMYINHNTSSATGGGGNYNDFDVNGFTLTNGVTYTRSWWVKSDITQTINGHMLSVNGGGNNTYLIGGDVNINPTWQRVHHTFTYTGTSNLSWRFRSINYNKSKVYIANIQLEASSTPSPFTATSRSDTQSLIDLKRTTSIDMNTVSYDSTTGQPDYDGSDDKGEVANFPHIWNSSCSIETVAMWHDDTRSGIFGNYDQGSGGHDINVEKVSGGSLRFYWDRGSRDVQTSSDANPAVTTNGTKHHHVVWVRELETNNFKFYVDGDLVTTVANAGGNIASTGSTFRFGADTRDGATVHNGSIPVLKAYNIALSAEQVKQNFKAYKNRFNL